MVTNRDTVAQNTKMRVEPAIMLPIKIKGRIIQFELDTSASVSVINEENWRKIGKRQITPTSLNNGL